MSTRTAARTSAARRAAQYPYADAHGRSVTRAWSGRHEPRDLREAVHHARRAYAVEVPSALTDGPASVGDDGNPRFALAATSYIFDGSRQERDGALAYEHYPFRFTLSQFLQGAPIQRVYGEIVWRIAAGGMAPHEAAVAAGVRPEAIGKLVAESALRAVMGRVSDLVVVTR